jgi:hypothetical protein
METIFQGVRTICWKIVSVNILGIDSKEPNVLLFSFLTTVALKINYFYLHFASNIVDRYTEERENKLIEFLFNLISVNLLLSLFLKSVTAESHCTVSVAMHSDSLGKCVTSLLPKLKLPTREFYYQNTGRGKTDCELSYFCHAFFGGRTSRGVKTPVIVYMKKQTLYSTIISVAVSLTLLAYNGTLEYHKHTAINIYSAFP